MTPANRNSPSSQSSETGVDAVAQRLRSAFHDSPYHELRGLQCRCDNGELTVRGRLPSYYLKQMAVKLVQRINDEVQIRIDVD